MAGYYNDFSHVKDQNLGMLSPGQQWPGVLNACFGLPDKDEFIATGMP